MPPPICVTDAQVVRTPVPDARARVIVPAPALLYSTAVEEVPVECALMSRPNVELPEDRISTPICVLQEPNGTVP